MLGDSVHSATSLHVSPAEPQVIAAPCGLSGVSVTPWVTVSFVYLSKVVSARFSFIKFSFLEEGFYGEMLWT